MSNEGCEETLKCDKEGYFDLDAMKPYSTVWVSNKRELRSRRNLLEDETEIRKDVTPSRACNDLHSLLESPSELASTENSDDDLTKTNQQPVITKSDHTPLNPYKLFDRMPSIPIKMINTKIGSHNKYESLNVTKEEERVNAIKNRNENNLDTTSQENLVNQQKEDLRIGSSDTRNCDAIDPVQEEEGRGFLSPQPSEENERRCVIDNEPSISSNLCRGEPIDDPLKKYQMLTENGKLVTELNITALNLKDKSGREFPVVIKYVWETEVSEVLGARDNIYNASQSLVAMIDNLSTIGTQENVWDRKTLTNGQDKEDRNIINDTCQQKNKMTFQSENVSVSTAKQNDCKTNMDNDTAIKYSTLKRNTLTNEGKKSRSARSKVSIVNNCQDKKPFENDVGDNAAYRLEESKESFEARGQSKLNIPFKQNIAEKQMRATFRKKVNSVNEIKAPSSARARPSTFKRKEHNTRICNRPPSAPYRETPTRIPIPQKVSDPSDKSTTAVVKKQIGNKCISTHAPTPCKLWK